METQFNLFPSVEPIGRRPFLKKWIHKKSNSPSPGEKGFEHYLDDIYRFLFQILEHQNLELAYRFRYTVEAAGLELFIKRQEKLEKALKRAKNKAYHPMEKILDEIQLEAGLDYDFQFANITFVFPLKLNSGKVQINNIRVNPEIWRNQNPDGSISETPFSGKNEAVAEDQEDPELSSEPEVDNQGFQYRKISLNENARFQLDEIRRIADGQDKTSEPELTEDQTETSSDRPHFDFGPGLDNLDAATNAKSNGNVLKTPIQYSLDAFSLPKPEPENVGIEDSAAAGSDDSDEDKVSRWAKYGYGKFLDSSPDQTEGDRARIEAENFIQNEMRRRFSAPPPLYNFRFEYKKHPEASYEGEDDPSKSLRISSECIKRRSEKHSESEHFLSNTEFWNFFHKVDDDRNFRDTTSLIIHQACINHRITHISIPTKHALSRPEEDLETFKAFDSAFVNSQLVEKNSESRKDFENTPDKLQEQQADEQEAHEKIREEVYQQSLGVLTRKDGMLFDYIAGKITIDNSDKHEIDKWVRNQYSVPTEIYRAFSEAVMQTESDELENIHKLVQLKLHKNDFPPQRVRDIFTRLQENNDTIRLDKKHLIKILKRQDYICESDAESQSSISFSRAYSRYRDWRSTLESPKIQVRTIDKSLRVPFIPTLTTARTWHFLDPPKIQVRTSSDYRKKPALPVIDKISNWKRFQHT